MPPFRVEAAPLPCHRRSPTRIRRSRKARRCRWIAPKDGVFFVAVYTGMIKNAVHPRAAQAFMNFLLDRDAQSAIAAVGYDPGDDVGQVADRPQRTAVSRQGFDHRRPSHASQRLVGDRSASQRRVVRRRAWLVVIPSTRAGARAGRDADCRQLSRRPAGSRRSVGRWPTTRQCSRTGSCCASCSTPRGSRW